MIKSAQQKKTDEMHFQEKLTNPYITFLNNLFNIQVVRSSHTSNFNRISRFYSQTKNELATTQN